MGLFTNPLSYAGYPPGVTGTPTTQNASIRAATLAEANAGVLDNVYISPSTQAAAVAVDFASPPALGFGSTTKRPVHATTLESTGNSTIGTTGATVNTIGSNNASSTTTITGGAAVLAITNTGIAVTGSVTASTGFVATTGGMTATAGNITATNGNFVKGTAGNKDIYSSVASTTTAGANSAGTVTLVGGTATISTTAVTANSIIRLYRQGVGSTGAAALGYLTIGTITPATSFVINAVQAANATANQASDVSVVAWEIVN